MTLQDAAHLLPAHMFRQKSAPMPDTQDTRTTLGLVFYNGRRCFRVGCLDFATLALMILLWLGYYTLLFLLFA
jgi:hypothetical protein